MEQRKRLPITVPTPVKSYLPIAVISSIADANLHSNIWIMNNFIQLFKYDWMDKFESFPIQNFMYVDQEFFQVSEINDHNFDFRRETFIDTIVEWIRKDNYVVVYADEFLLPGLRLFQETHVLHSQCIVGYDKVKETLDVLNFNKATGKLTIMEIAFKDMERAVFGESTEKLYKDAKVPVKLSGKMHVVELIRFQLKKQAYYECGLNYKHMFFEIENYVYSRDSSNFTNYFTGHVVGSWGMSIYDEIQKIIAGSQNKTIDYRIFHLLYEHKYYMRERLALFEEKDCPYSTQYEEVVRKSDTLRLKCIKYDMTLSEANRRKMKVFLDEIYELEKDILARFILEYKGKYNIDSDLAKLKK